MERVAADVPLTASELKVRLLWLLPEFGLQPFGVKNLGAALAEYRPSVGRVLYLDDLSDEEWVAGVIHEFGHVSLHPSGSDSYEQHLDDGPEECIVHNAAMLVCAAFGMYKYVDLLRARGVPERLLAPVPPALQRIVYSMVEWIEAAIRDPENPPARIDHLSTEIDHAS